MSESSDLVQHINTFNQIIGDLGRVGVKVDDEDQAMILLCLRDFVNRTYVWEKDDKSRDVLSCFLITRDDNIPAVISLRAMSCILVTTRKGEDKRRSKQMTRTSRDLSQRPRRKQLALVVEKQATSSEIAQTKNRINSEGSSKSANVVQNDSSESGDLDMISVTSNSHTDSWIPDLDFSFHMTPHREWFETYKVENLGSDRLRDNKTCGIIGIGQIKVRMHDGIIRMLTEVHHIPALKKNLISLGTLHVNGFDYKSDSDSVKVSKGL
ncbi:LOW QUALITY PROTEIN: hypothetical protein V2J09_022723 [Rumex salicifolius]